MSTHNKEAAELRKYGRHLGDCLGGLSNSKRACTCGFDAALTASEAPATEQAPTSCTRSHPHENMSAECEQKTIKARNDNSVRCAALRSEQAPAGEVPIDLTPVITWLENGCDPLQAAKELRIYRDATLSTPPAVPPGWKLVPEQPDQAMCQAGQWKAQEWPRFPLRIAPIYQAMLSAAPAAPQGEQPTNESAVSAAMAEGNKHGVKSTVAASIVATYLNALTGGQK